MNNTTTNQPTYFLFGDEAVRLLESEGLESFRDTTIPCSYYKWVDGESNPVNLLMQFYGWDNYAVITEDEYNFLVNL